MQTQSSAGSPQPLQTPSSIGLPHTSQGEHPHVWHICLLRSYVSFVVLGYQELLKLKIKMQKVKIQIKNQKVEPRDDIFYFCFVFLIFDFFTCTLFS
jgi:hypothetical protein